jgi:hypothetical protein
MSNVELIDDYLTNRLSQQDRNAFEAQMKSDPTLKADVEIQSQIVDGLKKARATELKAMLNRVPVGGPSSMSPLQIAAGVVGTAILVSSIYFYFKPDTTPDIPEVTSTFEDSSKQIEPIEEVSPIEEEKKESPAKQEKVEESTEQNSVAPPVDPKTPAKSVTKPALDIMDPSAELTESTATRGSGESSKPARASSKMEVEIDSSNKKYAFHYQFVSNKMILFGSFDKGLYEILEINGNINSRFLFYKENYYLLDDSKSEITPLEIIQDKTLLQKLKEYRKK